MKAAVFDFNKIKTSQATTKTENKNLKKSK